MFLLQLIWFVKHHVWCSHYSSHSKLWFSINFVQYMLPFLELYFETFSIWEVVMESTLIQCLLMGIAAIVPWHVWANLNSLSFFCAVKMYANRVSFSQNFELFGLEVHLFIQSDWHTVYYSLLRKLWFKRRYGLVWCVDWTTECIVLMKTVKR